MKLDLDNFSKLLREEDRAVCICVCHGRQRAEDHQPCARSAPFLSWTGDNRLVQHSRELAFSPAGAQINSWQQLRRSCAGCERGVRFGVLRDGRPGRSGSPHEELARDPAPFEAREGQRRRRLVGLPAGRGSTGRAGRRLASLARSPRTPLESGGHGDATAVLQSQQRRHPWAATARGQPPEACCGAASKAPIVPLLPPPFDVTPWHGACSLPPRALEGLLGRP
jgi:hypothetical protein